MQALMLAAGMGKRLGEYTRFNTKCMVEVAGERLIDRAIDALMEAGINRLILVVGYCAENLVDYLSEKYRNSSMQFEFIYNSDYATTNNIFSLYLAKKHMIEDDTILLESDLIYDQSLIKNLIGNQNKDVAVVARLKDWMDGTVVTLNGDGSISDFVAKQDMKVEDLQRYYKTVNIYKFSKEFSKKIYLPALERHIKEKGLGGYYETALKAVVRAPGVKLYGYEIGDVVWYEIDNSDDLETASVLFGNKTYS